MNAKELLTYLSLTYDGDWDIIYDAIKNKDKVDEEDAKNIYFVITHYTPVKIIAITDADYPKELVDSYKPPFVLFTVDGKLFSTKLSELFKTSNDIIL